MNFTKTSIYLLLLLVYTTTKAQGPNAPEAASFEPVDATDMVNLVTGDFTYVLPLLNVPSPEGGYPIALAYHAGIAMDQEASWVGLGWNLNPGAINRTVNGYPDDYNGSQLTEFFYDQGDKIEVYSLSLGYGTPEGSLSVGLGFSWGSHKSLGGHVSIGVGPGSGVGLGIDAQFGTDGASIGVGIRTPGGLSLGISTNSNGGTSTSIGFSTNDTGFRISASNNGTYGMSFTGTDASSNTVNLGFNLSSSGVGLRFGVSNKTDNGAGNYSVDGGMGVGLQMQFNNTISMGDYTIKTSSWMIPIMIPTSIGVISLTFGKQTFRYYLGKKEKNSVFGPVYFNDAFNRETENYLSCGAWGDLSGCTWRTRILRKGFMDIYEFSLEDTEFLNSAEINMNNPVYPNYDKYNVQAQGLSGSMSSRLYENGVLFGVPVKKNNQGCQINFNSFLNTDDNSFSKFDSRPYFYFDNEISSYLSANVSEAQFNTSNQDVPLSGYYSGGVETNSKPRRRNGSYIQYFTNKDLLESYDYQKEKGYLEPIANGFVRSVKPADGIGAFKITAMDGKTYHYALPVYNHEIITRTFGVIEDSPLESESYFEKRQLEPYATHWLLTAVTGPDYIDKNNNGFTDNGDYGYWVSFEYGKWSDAFIWKTPYATDYFEDGEDDNIKTTIKGRKEVYYLDKIKTRTHAAIFVKSERDDGQSEYWKYESVSHKEDEDQTSSNYVERFTIPRQKPLRLNHIILVKDEDDTINTSDGISNEAYETILYNDSDKAVQTVGYDLKDNIIDIGDDWQILRDKALKIVDLNYDYSLVENAPNTTSSNYGRLTLNSVEFKGKQGIQNLPPYTFEYFKDYLGFDIDKKDDFGYYRDHNEAWSLAEIQTPLGGKIEVNYETHQFKSLTDHLFSKISTTDYSYEMSSLYSLKIGDKVQMLLRRRWRYGPIRDCDQGAAFYEGVGTITNIKGNTITVSPDGQVIQSTSASSGCSESFYLKTTFNIPKEELYNPVGGIRTSSITTSDGDKANIVKYKYGGNGEGYGYISYFPFAPELQVEVPYSSELPAPKVMYEYVTMESSGADDISEGSVQYRFNVFKEKDPNRIKFGDLYEISCTTQSEHYNSMTDKDVSIKNYTIKDNLANLGQLLEISTFNIEGQLLQKIINQYYKPEETPNRIGVTKEAYQSYKIVDYDNNSDVIKDKWLINSSSRIKYPSLLKKSTEINTNFISSSDFGSLDSITGKSTEIISMSSTGDKIKNISIPAYYKYPSLGSMVDNISNNNMLTQGAITSTLIDVEGSWKTMAANITTWNNNWTYSSNDGSENTPSQASEKIWRKHKNLYMGRGLPQTMAAIWGMTAAQMIILTGAFRQHRPIQLESCI